MWRSGGEVEGLYDEWDVCKWVLMVETAGGRRVSWWLCMQEVMRWFRIYDLEVGKRSKFAHKLGEMA